MQIGIKKLKLKKGAIKLHQSYNTEQCLLQHNRFTSPEVGNPIIKTFLHNKKARKSKSRSKNEAPLETSSESDHSDFYESSPTTHLTKYY